MKVGEKFHNIDGNKFAIESVYNNDPYLAEVKAIKDQGLGQSGDNRLVGRIPLHMVAQWLKEAGVRWDDAAAKQDVIKKKIMSGEFAKFRVWDGTF